MYIYLLSSVGWCSSSTTIVHCSYDWLAVRTLFSRITFFFALLFSFSSFPPSSFLPSFFLLTLRPTHARGHARTRRSRRAVHAHSRRRRRPRRSCASSRAGTARPRASSRSASTAAQCRRSTPRHSARAGGRPVARSPTEEEESRDIFGGR